MAAELGEEAGAGVDAQLCDYGAREWSFSKANWPGLAGEKYSANS